MRYKTNKNRKGTIIGNFFFMIIFLALSAYVMITILGVVSNSNLNTAGNVSSNYNSEDYTSNSVVQNLTSAMSISFQLFSYFPIIVGLGIVMIIIVVLMRVFQFGGGSEDDYDGETSDDSDEDEEDDNDDEEPRESYSKRLEKSSRRINEDVEKSRPKLIQSEIKIEEKGEDYFKSNGKFG